MNNEKGNAAIALPVAIWTLGAWFTHVIVCLGTGSWGFLIAGALVFPIAVIHGTGCWFGVW